MLPQHQKWIRSNLCDGRHPRARKSDPRIGEPKRLLVHEWVAWLAEQGGRAVPESLDELAYDTIGHGITGVICLDSIEAIETRQKQW